MPASSTAPRAPGYEAGRRRRHRVGRWTPTDSLTTPDPARRELDNAMRPTVTLLLGLLLCASIHARPWQLAHCRGPKQAKYSAAWLAASELLRALPESYLNTSRLFKRGTMMEAASFLLLEKTATFKTRDFLDFYVEHLSWSVHKSNIATRLCRDSIMTSTPSTRRQARRRGGVVSRRSIQPARPRSRR